MAFGWDNPIQVEIMNEDSSGTRVVGSTPRMVIEEPNRHRSEDIILSVCAVLYELVLMNEAQVASSEKMLDMMKNKVEEKPKKQKISFKRGK